MDESIFGSTTFDDETVSESDLGFDDGATAADTGNADPTGTTETGQTADADTDAQDVQPAGVEGQEPESQGPELKADGKESEPQTGAEAQKPPRGFVPIQAIHEARGQIKAERAKVAALEQRFQAISQGTANPDFKVLSREDAVALSEEDPAEYAAYQYDLAQHQTGQQSLSQQGQIREALSNAHDGMINASWAAVRQTVPGLFAADGNRDPVAEQALVYHASEHLGIDAETLNIITNPATQILGPGGEIIPLGLGAASVIQMLHQNSKGSDTAALRQQIEAELRPKIVQELTKKMRSPGATGNVFQSISSATGRKDTFSGGGDSEDDWFGMSGEEEDRLLRGN